MIVLYLFSSLSDDELDKMVLSIKNQHPAAGEVILRGQLKSRGIYVQRSRLRSCLRRLDERNNSGKVKSPFCHSPYVPVPCPNYLWNIIGIHELIRWKFVIHVGIDEFSSTALYCRCSPSNKPSTVRMLFEEAVEQHGLPLKVGTNQGGENKLVWSLMLEKHLNDNTLMVDSNVHNRRLQNFCKKLVLKVLDDYVNLFYSLEKQELLTPYNDPDLFVLHFVFLPIINRKLDEFRYTFNNSRLPTERSFSPLQLYAANMQFLPIYSLDSCGVITADEINLNHPYHIVHVHPPPSPLTPSQLVTLDEIVSNSGDVSEVDLFKLATEFTNKCQLSKLSKDSKS